MLNKYHDLYIIYLYNSTIVVCFSMRNKSLIKAQCYTLDFWWHCTHKGRALGISCLMMRVALTGSRVTGMVM